ncbi:flagellar basal body P-ring protein FlgI, partial [Escherichia coli]|uniref:flagellar basal body P-ring protein FlgI n=2 Tax=Gammaproteobacteria TaxID=1236 RepID=UPI00228030DB
MAEVDVRVSIAVLLLVTLFHAGSAHAGAVKVKDIARVAGVRENQLTGYGLVFGLSGSGDSQRNRATVQSVANTLRNFGVNVVEDDI